MGVVNLKEGDGDPVPRTMPYYSMSNVVANKLDALDAKFTCIMPSPMYVPRSMWSGTDAERAW